MRVGQAMFFPRFPGLRRRAPKPQQPTPPVNPNHELRPNLNLSKVELLVLLLIK